MATSFSAAALGAEGLAADVTMIVGNGYVPGHADLALEIVRSDAGGARPVRAEAVMVSTLDRRQHRRSSTSTRRTVRKARSLARKVGRPIVEARAGAHHASRSSGPRCAWPAWPAPTPTARRGSTGSPTRCAPTSASSTGWRCPVWDALLRGEAEDLATLAQKASAGSARFRLPEGRDAAAGAGRASRKQVGAGVRRIDARRARARAAGRARSATRPASRGST